nr:MAG TPA: hypothetical protein [Caudoviricetes sp.]
MSSLSLKGSTNSITSPPFRQIKSRFIATNTK